jgi:hypothetical protein
VLEKDGKCQLDRRREKLRSITNIKEKTNILHTIKRRKANWIGHILRKNRLLKHVIEGKIEETGRLRRGGTEIPGGPYGKEKIMEIERGSTRAHCVENSLWYRLWACRKTDTVKNES